MDLRARFGFLMANDIQSSHIIAILLSFVPEYELSC